MKKILLSVVILISCTQITSCDNIDKSDLEYHANYYYKKGKMYHTLDYTVGLTDTDRQEMWELQREEESYINSLNSEERDYYYEYIRSL